MSPLERRCRALVRAWPLGVRRERGNELVGTMLDVIPAGRQWPPLLLALDTVWSGWMVRLRRRPPFWRWLAYVSGVGRMDERSMPWLIDDVTSPGFGRRRAMPQVLSVVACELILLTVTMPRFGFAHQLLSNLRFIWLANALGTWRRGEVHRTKAIGRNGAHLSATPVSVGHWEWRRRPMGSNVPVTDLLLAIGLPLVVAGSWMTPTMFDHRSTVDLAWIVTVVAISTIALGVALPLSLFAARQLGSMAVGAGPLERRFRPVITLVGALLVALSLQGPLMPHSTQGHNGAWAILMLAVGVPLLGAALSIGVIGLVAGRPIGTNEVLPELIAEKCDWVWIIDPQPPGAITRTLA